LDPCRRIQKIAERFDGDTQRVRGQLILDLEARAKTVKGARALLKAGFEYVTNIKGKKIFRKRK